MLFATPLAAQSPRPIVGQVSFEATFTIEDQQGDLIAVNLRYTGQQLSGSAIAVYTPEEGERIRDVMLGCMLTDANGIWKIDCQNPHYSSFDGVYSHTYMCVSPPSRTTA